MDDMRNTAELDDTQGTGPPVFNWGDEITLAFSLALGVALLSVANLPLIFSSRIAGMVLMTGFTLLLALSKY